RAGPHGDLSGARQLTMAGESRSRRLSYRTRVALAVIGTSLLLVNLTYAAAWFVPRLYEDQHPMTWALELPDPSAFARLEESRQANGWGLPHTFDAFEDWTWNPPDTSYAITTAIVLDGYLRSDAIGEEELAVAERWAELFSDGFYPYSDQPH